MDILQTNISWMVYNIYLALLPLLFLWLFLHVNRKVYKVVFGFLWLIYLPNSIYIFADLSHLIEQWSEVGGVFEKCILLLQYAVLEIVGLTAYILALYPMEDLLKKSAWFKTDRSRFFLIIGINFLLGFCIVIGRIERVNSWDILIATEKVIQAGINTLSSVELVVLSILFGLFANFFYFLFKKPVVQLLRIFDKKP